MKLYIVIHIIYLCKKPDSVDFPRKTPKFLIQKRTLRVKFLHIPDLLSSYKQIVFSAMEARFRRIFMRIIAILPGFSIFFQTIQGQGTEISDFQARESLLRLKRK